jgi:hypothetical protein
VSPELVERATLEWLEALRTRSSTAGSLSAYSDDLALATMAGALVDADRLREGVQLHDGELTIERLVVEEGTGPAAIVDLEATIVFPADSLDGLTPEMVAPNRALRQLTVPLGSVYFEEATVTRELARVRGSATVSTETDSGLRLIDYTRNTLRMSEMWCTHPQGEAVSGGLAAVPQAVTREAHGGGRVFVEVSNALDREVVLRLGRPDRPRGLFTRQPPIEAPEAGLTVPAGGSTHFVGLTRRSRLTEVEMFAFDALERTPVAALLLQIELPRGHPGEHGQWCG